MLGASLLLLAGCQTELYSGLSEQQGNEMFSLLIDHGIDIKKVAGKDKTVDLTVEEKEMSKTIAILKKYGYPKEEFTTMGEVFVKDGMISSPLEEKARYHYALSQELAGTIALIDGVMSARVHVVLPQEDAYGERAIDPTASVFIKHSNDISKERLVPKIKMMVASSIEGLGFDAVTVGLFEAMQAPVFQREPLVNIGFITVKESSASTLYIIFGVVLLVLIAAIACVLILFNKHKAKAGEVAK